MTSAPARCSLSPILSASLKTAARATAERFLLANGRGAQVDPAPRRSPASPSLRLPNLPEAPPPAASCWPRRLRPPTSKRALPTASWRASETHIRSGEREPALAPAAPARRDCASPSSRARCQPTRPRRALLAEGVARLGIERLPWTRALRQWRDRVMFLRRAEGDEWPDLSDAALAADVDWLAAIFAGKTALAELSADEFAAALRRRASLSDAAAARCRSADPFRLRQPARARPSTMRRKAARKSPSASRSCSASTAIPAIAGGKVPLVDRTAVAGAPAGADDTRPARLLARQLRRRARRKCAAAIRNIRGRTIRSTATATTTAKRSGAADCCSTRPGPATLCRSAIPYSVI